MRIAPISTSPGQCGHDRNGPVGDRRLPIEQAGIEVAVPAAAEQKRVMDAICGKRGIKAGFTEGRPREVLLEAADGLVRRGARAVLAGCTEVPLVLRAGDLAVPLVEPMALGARAAVKRAAPGSGSGGPSS